MTKDRRQFARIRFQTDARLRLPEGECDAEVLDLSLKGALVRPKAPIFATVGSGGSLSVPLDGPDTVIAMEVTVVHRQGGDFGLACREIDLDSITHLRRLVELNLGDESLLQRDLTMLGRPDEAQQPG